ncbi:MAG TPA: 30S ribosomal protein S12 methylthiotransferase RimO [Firmicutes bacterium]|nr:30S ribosomal protein S12 methylthiotransferase RimO [Bacillota bacterium]
MRTSVALVSLGCAKNLVDSEVMIGLLSEAGFEPVVNLNKADVLLVNTCAFIDEAQEEAIDTILGLAELKKKDPCRKLVVTGCLAQRFPEDLLREIPEIDAVVGTGDFARIVEVVKDTMDGKRVNLVSRQPCFIYDETFPRRISTPRHTAYIKIAEGCSNRCSYCVIPFVRGKFRSRPIASIVEEARKLAQDGARELILIAQDTTRYGQDLYGKYALDKLLQEVCRIDEVEWVRVLYMYPTRVTDELIRVIAREPKVCKYVDLPLQHVDDELLKLMNRHGRHEDARQTIDRLRQAVPDITIRSTFIVGFPGETEAKFQSLLDFLEEARLDRVGVFTYSPQSGTPASRFSGRVKQSVKERRRQEAMEVQRMISREKNASKIGQIMKVLIEGRAEESELVTIGRSQAEAPEIDGLVYIGNAHPEPGEFRFVRITDASDYDLVGEIVSSH